MLQSSFDAGDSKESARYLCRRVRFCCIKKFILNASYKRSPKASTGLRFQSSAFPCSAASSVTVATRATTGVLSSESRELPKELHGRDPTHLGWYGRLVFTFIVHHRHRRRGRLSREDHVPGDCLCAPRSLAPSRRCGQRRRQVTLGSGTTAPKKR
ncbi:hypothetical protein MTO96_019652 [Rhipicephalus appendiculatus]